MLTQQELSFKDKGKAFFFACLELSKSFSWVIQEQLVQLTESAQCHFPT